MPHHGVDDITYDVGSSMHFSRCVALAALFLILSCIAAIEAAPITFGTRQLQIPAPTNFEAIGKRAPQQLLAMQAFVPKSIRNVEMYTTAPVAAQLEHGHRAPLGRYFLLQVNNQDEGKPFSFEQFADKTDQIEAELKRQMQNRHVRDNQYVAQAIAQHGNATAANQALDASTEFLGLTRKEPWGIFYAVRFKDSDGGETIAFNAIVTINYQLLSFAVYAPFHGAQDRAWADLALRDWVSAIRSANPDDPAIAATIPKHWTSESFQLIGRAVGALVGVSLALLVMARRKRAR
jgi:hypothetical protein